MLSKLLKPQTIVVNIESTDKDMLFAELLEVLVRENPSIDRDDAMDALLLREAQMNTCICKGVAVPHAVCDCVASTVVALGLSREGVDYGADGIAAEIGVSGFQDALVHIVIMILGERDSAEHRLKILTSCANILQKAGFYQRVLAAQTADEVLRVIADYETE